MRGHGKLQEKPQAKKAELAEILAKRMRISKMMAMDFIDVYASVLFDTMLDNKEVYIQYVGRIWISEPREAYYGDHKTGEKTKTITYPQIKFKPMSPFKAALRGPAYTALKKKYKASLKTAEQLIEDEEFKKIFITDVQPKGDHSRFLEREEDKL